MDVKKLYKIIAQPIGLALYLTDIRPDDECQRYFKSCCQLYLARVSYAHVLLLKEQNHFNASILKLQHKKTPYRWDRVFFFYTDEII